MSKQLIERGMILVKVEESWLKKPCLPEVQLYINDVIVHLSGTVGEKYRTYIWPISAGRFGADMMEQRESYNSQMTLLLDVPRAKRVDGLLNLS